MDLRFSLRKVSLFLSLLRDSDYTDNIGSDNIYHFESFVSSDDDIMCSDACLLIRGKNGNYIKYLLVKEEDSNFLHIDKIKNNEEKEIYELEFSNILGRYHCSVSLIDNDLRNQIAAYEFNKDILSCDNLDDVEVLDRIDFKNLGANYGRIHS